MKRVFERPDGRGSPKNKVCGLFAWRGTNGGVKIPVAGVSWIFTLFCFIFKCYICYRTYLWVVGVAYRMSNFHRRVIGQPKRPATSRTYAFFNACEVEGKSATGVVQSRSC